MTKIFRCFCVLVLSLFLVTGMLPVHAEETPVSNILDETAVQVMEEDGTQITYLKAYADPASLKESDVSDWYFNDVAEKEDLSYAVLVFDEKTDEGIFVKDGKFYTGKTLLDGITLKIKEDGSYEVPDSQHSFEVTDQKQIVPVETVKVPEATASPLPEETQKPETEQKKENIENSSVAKNNEVPATVPVRMKAAKHDARGAVNNKSASDDKVEAFVQRLYKTALNRNADESGLSFWTGRLKAKTSNGAGVAYGFIFSDEFISKNYCNEHYLTKLYQALLGRDADSAGLEFWLGMMNDGASRETIFNGFINSTEFTSLCETYGILRGDSIVTSSHVSQRGACPICGKESDTMLFIKRLYTEGLGREADENGLQFWNKLLAEDGGAGSNAAYGFVFSDEFKNKNYCNYHFIYKLYRILLNRDPDDSGMNHWLDQFTAGASREDIFNGIAMSDEFTSLCRKYHINRGGTIDTGTRTYQNGKCPIDGKEPGEVTFVNRLYETGLGRKADSNGFNNWVNLLRSAGATGSLIAFGFIFSPEFKSKNYCNEHYLEKLYSTIMGRESDENGKAFWMSQMRTGVSRESVFNAFVTSSEFTQLCKENGIVRGNGVDTDSVTIPNGRCAICGKLFEGFSRENGALYYYQNSELVKSSFNVDGVFYNVNPSTGEILTSQKTRADSVYAEGIDVSEWNDVDLNNYRDGFVIIRGGWSITTDKKAIAYMNKCDELHIPYGVYWYSYARDEDEARDEADAFLKVIKNRNITCGVWMDMENDNYKQRNGVNNQGIISRVCEAFCERVASAGYHTGIYSGYNYYNSYIKGLDQYDKWIAHYGETNDGNWTVDLSGMASMQQYTSNPLDRDLMFKPMYSFR